MQSEVSKSRLTFLTVTLPNVNQAESIRLSENWGEVVRIFIQRLKRFLRSHRLPGEVLGVTEVQEKRAFLTGVFGLHLHMVFVGRKRSHGWVLTPKDVKEFWRSALSKFLDNPVTAYDWRAVENLQRVRKDAAGYLGKYMSKGLKSVEKLRALFPDVKFPRHWYFCTNSIRKRVKAGTIKVTGEMGLILAELCERDRAELIPFKKQILIDVGNGRELAVGWYGRLVNEGVIMFSEFSQVARR